MIARRSSCMQSRVLFPEPSGCCRKNCPVALHGKGGKIAIGYILEDELATGSVSYRIALWDCLGEGISTQFPAQPPKVDNAIHWENIYPVESVIGFFNSLDSYLFGE